MRLFRRPISLFLLSLVSAITIAATGATAAPPNGAPDFTASFDGTLDAVDRDGHTIAPEIARGIRFVDGLHGKAAYLGGNGDPDFAAAPMLQYPANRLLDSTAGTVMFWVRPDWDGEAPGKARISGDPAFYRFFDGGPKFNLFMYYWLRFDLGVVPQPPADPADSLQVMDRSRGSWMRGDWKHVALTWDTNGWTKLYVDGLPYGNGLSSSANMVKRALNFGTIDHFLVGSQAAGVFPPNMRADAAFSDLKIYKRALSETAIMSEYRRFMPLDITVERQYVRAGRPEQFAVDVWPGGQMTRPAVGNPVPVPVETSVTATLVRDADGKTVARRMFPLNLRGQTTLTLSIAGLQEGVYRAVYRFAYGGGKFQKSFRAFAYRPKLAAPESDQPYKTGTPIVTIDCASQATRGLEQGATTVVQSPSAGAYREAGSARDSRFSYELDLSSLARDGVLDGRPMELEVTWPDDKPRSMGLYLYRPSHDKEQRERLEGGVQGGEEFALSGRMQAARYIIYPWFPKYLFEARTMVEGMPAAVSQIVVRPIAGRLPKLAIRGARVSAPRSLPLPFPHPGGAQKKNVAAVSRPAPPEWGSGGRRRPISAQAAIGGRGPSSRIGTLEGRSFGHLDEDQSFDFLLALDSPDIPSYRRPVDDLEMLLDYLDYTGQNVISYPFIRYGDIEYALPGSTTSSAGSLFFGYAGWRSLMLDMMAARGKKVIATVNEYSVMEGNKLPDRHDTLLAQNYYQIDKSGKVMGDYLLGQALANPLNPIARGQFMGHLHELLRRFGHHPGLAGIDLWPFGDWQIKDINTGYDDLTIRIFEHDTGIAVPGGSGQDRFGTRFAFLTGPKRKQWLAWRAKKNTEFLTEMVRTIRACNPGLSFGLVLNGTPTFGSKTDASGEGLDFARYYYEEQGLDIAELRRISGLALCPMRWPTQTRWQQHWDKTLTTTDEILDDMTRQAFFRNKGQSRAYSYQTYFESFNDSLKPDTYSALFQNADVKPHGRFFLKELAEDMASADPSTILIGAQPLGTSGRDTETREFAQAFRALPQGNFIDIPGARAPVYARSLTTRQSTYVYAQNVLDGEVTVTLKGGSNKAIDLSSGKPLPLSGKTLTIVLKPFQLRSFRIAARDRKLAVTAITIEEGVHDRYRRATMTTAAMLETLRAQGGDFTLINSLVAKLRLAVQEDRLAEAHRLLFSKPIRALASQVGNASQGFLKPQK